MLVSSNLTAPPFIYYIQCYKIVLMFYNISTYAIRKPRNKLNKMEDKMEDKILKQIEEKYPVNMVYATQGHNAKQYDSNLEKRESAKYGYNIKESVDEKLVEALKNINVICGGIDCTSVQHMKEVIQLTLEWSFNALSASQNTEKHICEPMVNANWTRLQCNCGKEFSVGGNTVSNEGEKKVFTENDIAQLQNRIHKIVGNGEVMQEFNKILGNNAG